MKQFTLGRLVWFRGSWSHAHLKLKKLCGQTVNPWIGPPRCLFIFGFLYGSLFEGGAYSEGEHWRECLKMFLVVCQIRVKMFLLVTVAVIKRARGQSSPQVSSCRQISAKVVHQRLDTRFSKKISFCLGLNGLVHFLMKSTCSRQIFFTYTCFF